jgi:hypothetical protein
VIWLADELARIQDAVNAVDAVTAPNGVTLEETTDPTQATVTLDLATTSPVGGYADGILGCFDPSASQITLIEGWNWYAGSDPGQIGAGQYDFETTVTHELGHALGLGESDDPTSAMFGTLATGTVMRTLTTADLNIPYDEAGADAQRAALPQVAVVTGAGPEASQAVQAGSGSAAVIVAAPIPQPHGSASPGSDFVGLSNLSAGLPAVNGPLPGADAAFLPMQTALDLGPDRIPAPPTTAAQSSASAGQASRYGLLSVQPDQDPGEAAAWTEPSLQQTAWRARQRAALDQAFAELDGAPSRDVPPDDVIWGE